jgi:hypothetical protein
MEKLFVKCIGLTPSHYLATPADGDRYGIGWTDLRAVAAVDALGRPVR